MKVLLEAVALPPDPPDAPLRKVTFFAYPDERLDDGSVRDWNNALTIVRSLTGKSGDWHEGEPPRSPLHTPLWQIIIHIFNSHARSAKYVVQYQKLYQKLDFKNVDLMMRTYHAIKRAFKRGRKTLELEKQARRDKLQRRTEKENGDGKKEQS